MSIQPTPYAIRDMYNQQKPQNPIVQVLNFSSVTAKGGNERYKLTISDGTYKMSATLAMQLNELITNRSIIVNSLICLDTYVVNDLSNKRIAILLKVTIVSTMVPGVIGNPVSVENPDLNAAPATNTVMPAPRYSAPAMPAAPVSAPIKNIPVPVQNTATFNSMPSDCPLLSIQQLNPYIGTKWTIKGRVISKSPLRHWSNARGEGDLFSVNIIDNNNTEIRGTFFNEPALHYHNIIEQGNVYCFSRGTIKPANRRFSSVNNDYEISFDKMTTVVPQQEDSSISQDHIQLVKINDIPAVKAGNSVDVLGIIIDAGNCDEITTRAGKQMKKRVLKLKDESNSVINLTLFGEQAQLPTEQFVIGSPIIVKAAKVSDFNGCSLTFSFDSEFNFNPNVPEAQTLLQWYNNGGQNMPDVALSGGQSSSFRSDPYNVDQRGFLNDIVDKNLGMGEKADFLTVSASILHIRKDNCIYPSCTNTFNEKVCKKKMIDIDGNSWRCERCGFETAEPHYCYMLSIQISDDTQTQWVTLFDDQAAQLLGMSADDYHQQLQQGMDVDAFFKQLTFKDYIFTLRVKMDTMSQLNQVRCVCSNVIPMDYIQDAQYLIQYIDKYSH